MFLSADEISRCTNWLLAHASAPVRYLTYQHILQTDPASAKMAELWQEVECGADAEEIFSRQNPDGSFFSGGPWGPRGYRRESGRGYTATRPKFVTTAWLLPYLGEMGFTARDERVRKSCEFILQDIGAPNRLPDPLPGETNTCGLYAIPLRALASVGMGEDERIRENWRWLGLCQRKDGGWLNPNHLAGSPSPSTTQGRWPWDRSCAWGSNFAVEAFYYSPNPQHLPAFRASLEFMLWHLSQAKDGPVQTWVYHGHNTVKELLMASQVGVGLDSAAVQALLAWLKGYYRPEEGMFRTQEKPIPDFVRHISAIYKDFAQKYGPDFWESVSKTGQPVLRYHLYHLVEDDWLTYYLTRIAKNLARQEGNLS
jgi:hypothetical protein